jgi:hypothetical protein
MSMGRPSDYTDELAEEICAQVSEGKSLTDICESESMPARRTVYRWLREKPDFHRLYDTAVMDRADIIGNEIIGIADDTSGDFITDDKGRTVVDHENINRSRLRVDARKFVASRLNPRKWGERTEIVGAGGAPLFDRDSLLTDDQRTFETARRIAFILEKGKRILEQQEAPPLLTYEGPKHVERPARRDDDRSNGRPLTHPSLVNGQ